MFEAAKAIVDFEVRSYSMTRLIHVAVYVTIGWGPPS